MNICTTQSVSKNNYDDTKEKIRIEFERKNDPLKVLPQNIYIRKRPSESMLSINYNNNIII
jgi:hypothetical protein